MPSIQSTIRTHRRTTAVSLFLAISALCALASIVAVTFLRRNHMDTSAADVGVPVGLSVDVASMISLTTDATGNTLSIPITPMADGASGSNDLTVSVHTNNLTGYTLTMSSTGTDTSLAHYAETTQKIPSTTNTLETPAALANNTWGYSVWANGQSTSSTTFSRIPALSAPDTLRTTSAISDPTDTTLTFGARINTKKPSGTYTNTIVFSATSNYAPPFIPYMQSFTIDKCKAVADGEMVELRDQRDDTVYRVKKMIDGNCWMVDNLALDLTTDYYGKPDWGTTPITLSGTDDARENNVPQQTLNSKSGYESYGQIPNNGKVKASYLYNWCAALADTSTDCSASVAAAQYNTVVNGATNTTGTATSQPAVTGICPAPFRLPKGGPEATSSDAATSSNEFAKLDIAMGGTGANRSDRSINSLWRGSDTANTNWLGVLGGRNSDHGGLDGQGAVGQWWSSTADGASSAYYLYLGAGTLNVFPAFSGAISDGFAVRCVL